MAPMIGPKLAPTIVKNPIRLAATPVIASRTPTAAAAIVLDTRGTPGIIVLKLLPAMNAQKHEAGIDAMANRNSMADAIGPPMACTTSPKSQLCVTPPPPLSAARVHPKPRPRRARRGEEPDHDGDHRGECPERILLRRRYVIVPDTARRLKEDHQDRKEHTSELQSLRHL